VHPKADGSLPKGFEIGEGGTGGVFAGERLRSLPPEANGVRQ
jgi:hypothetical protein